MSDLIIPEEIKPQFSIDSNGVCFLSLRALSRIAGVQHTSISRLIKEKGGALELSLELVSHSAKRFEGGAPIQDLDSAKILEYYAMDAGRYCTQQAKTAYKAFSAIGIRAWIQSELRWQQPQVQPLTPSQALLQSVMMLVEIEQKLAIQDQRLMVIEAEKQQANEELTRLPLSTDLAPEIPLRGKINMIVRNKAQRDLISYNALWAKLYQEMYYRLSYDVKARCRHSGMKPLDQIEKDKMFDALYAIASEVLV